MQQISKLSKQKTIPTSEDLDMAALGILKLQKVYKLKTEDLASGQLTPQTLKSSSMTASDCFEIGKISYLNEDYDNAVSWLQKSLDLFDENSLQNSLVQRESILEYLIYVFIRQKNSKKAQKLALEIAKILSVEELRAIDNFQKELPTKKIPKSDDNFENLLEDYEAGCRGELKLPENVTKSLQCRYTHNNIDFLRIAPLKLEEVHKPQPYIVIYHQVVSNNEIELIKELGKPLVSELGFYQSFSNIFINQ